MVTLATFAFRGDAQQRDDRAARSSTARVPTGWEVAGVPALNFDADEGFGYGAVLELYNYGRGAQPYRYTIQPTVFFTTEGRRDYTVFFDGPSLLPDNWRVTAFAGREQQLAQPYYGIGNSTPYDPNAEQGANPYFYRFGRTRLRATTDFQHRLGRSSARFLIGGGVSNSTIDPIPFDSGTTLLAAQTGGNKPWQARTNYVRAGLVWDTRDREVGPARGTWAELLIQSAGRALGATENFTRWTGTIREYIPITRRLTFAQRLTAQQVVGDAPFDELSIVQSSFKQQEGLGGSTSIRGLPKDRYIGKGLALSNSELRWRASEFSFLARQSFLALSAFTDAGRVWANGLRLDQALDGLHVGYGGGARIGVGPSFIVATDLGHSSQSAAAAYVGLGWLF
jgi:outer membrane protein assembly factor BamA